MIPKQTNGQKQEEISKWNAFQVKEWVHLSVLFKNVVLDNQRIMGG